MNEITTTINGLLITSRQIADHAVRVARTAENTATAAHSGNATIEQTRRSQSVIRAQVDQIVHHMTGLGEKSQQIGSVVDLVAETGPTDQYLGHQRPIEATGAGEWGRRFAVVADEIRKLADRTAASANQIRMLVDDVRDAVGTTVTATEIGATAVDSGTRQFDDATDSFQQIAQLVMTTNDATREIELSTQQQSAAMEQVNLAASDTNLVRRPEVSLAATSPPNRRQHERNNPTVRSRDYTDPPTEPETRRPNQRDSSTLAKTPSTKTKPAWTHALMKVSTPRTPVPRVATTR